MTTTTWGMIVLLAFLALFAAAIVCWIAGEDKGTAICFSSAIIVAAIELSRNRRSS